MSSLPMIHFSFPVDDVERARKFYGEALGCPEGRKLPRRADFRFFGHHLVGHLARPADVAEPKIDGNERMPARHFGLIVSTDEFEEIADRLKKANWPFVVPPKTTNPGTIREHRVVVVRDGCGNTLEFKGFENVENIFED